MKLSKKAAKDIASIVNAIQCADMMLDAMKAKNDRANEVLFRATGYRKTIELADKYGIELPTLDLARKNLASEEAYYDQLTLVG